MNVPSNCAPKVRQQISMAGTKNGGFLPTQFRFRTKWLIQVQGAIHQIFCNIFCNDFSAIMIGSL
jgi:hypothetical protein